MALNLKIENMTNLPDGNPLSIAITGKRGIDIGRDSRLDWTLPDPTRYISGKRAEIRYQGWRLLAAQPMAHLYGPAVRCKPDLTIWR